MRLKISTFHVFEAFKRLHLLSRGFLCDVLDDGITPSGISVGILLMGADESCRLIASVCKRFVKCSLSHPSWASAAGEWWHADLKPHPLGLSWNEYLACQRNTEILISTRMPNIRLSNASILLDLMGVDRVRGNKIIGRFRGKYLQPDLFLSYNYMHRS